MTRRTNTYLSYTQTVNGVTYTRVVIISGELDGPAQRHIRHCCVDAVRFLPDQVGLPQAIPEGTVINDPCASPWASLSDPACELTLLPPDYSRGVLDAFTAATGHWNEEAARRLLGIPWLTPPAAADTGTDKQGPQPQELGPLDASAVTHVALARQRGHGCDYTIGCGRRWFYLSAESDQAALQQLKQGSTAEWHAVDEENYDSIVGRHDDETALQELVLIRVAGLVLVDVDEIYRRQQRSQRYHNTRQRELAERRLLRELANRYPDELEQENDDD